MNRTFDCPNCGAPLDYEDNGELTIRCPFCRNSVIVPEEERSTAPLPTSRPVETQPSQAEPVDPVLARLQELASTETDPHKLKHMQRIERRMVRRQERDEERRQKRQERGKE